VLRIPYRKRYPWAGLLGWLSMIQNSGSWGGYNLRWNKRRKPKRPINK